ncbi:MAG: AAA family ATPase [Ilumatobacteraceae bacterium]
METLSRAVGGSFARVQFTPDLLPSDITDTRVYRGSSERFDVELGPIFVNFLLADEINRAPAKAVGLLEVMAEHRGHDRRHHPSGPRAVPRHGDPEPDRVRGVYQLPGLSATAS